MFSFPFPLFGSQADYFSTQQLALLLIFATFIHPGTLEIVNISFAFLTDEESHSSVGFFFSIL